MQSNDRLALLQLLKNAGWFPGRSIQPELINLPLARLLPEKVMHVFSEFGDLGVISRYKENSLFGRLDMTHTKALFSSEKLVKFYEPRDFENTTMIDIALGEEDSFYYFSVLLGTQLYAIATVEVEEGVLLMDRFGNMYILDGIGNLSWVAPNFWDGLGDVFFRTADYIPFYEDDVKWMFNKDHNKGFIPPINKSLNGRNPFLYKKQYPEK